MRILRWNVIFGARMLSLRFLPFVIAALVRGRLHSEIER